MPRPRRALVSVSDTPYYHVFSRCVRRAFLCGTDKFSGKSYEHRRGWIEDRIRVLSSLFSIEICAYAVMSNHYHLVVKLNPDEAQHWPDDEVLKRWTTLFKGPLLVQRQASGETLDSAEQDTVRSIAAVYRSRLASLSWFMKCLNEPIARKANAEDGCTGHFWEARFQSQALVSERALVTAMAYVDLNPVRAGIAESPESSYYTGIRARILGQDTLKSVRTAARRLRSGKEIRHVALVPRRLAPFADEDTAAGRQRLPIAKNDYLELVDSTGRLILRGKRGRVDPSLAPVLERLELSSEAWTRAVVAFRQQYHRGDLKTATFA